VGAEAVEFTALYEAGKPAFSFRLAGEFEGKLRLAAPGTAGQHAN
jgi:hypothetical protein